MNAVAKIVPSQDEAIRVLQNSLYPNAKRESIEMVLAYCRLQNLDPFLKSVHIVPMWDEASRSMRDVLMPGIADYRIKASRTSEYAGKSEPEFGSDITRKIGVAELTYPAWCRVTIQRIVGGEPRSFTAKEFWLENYATAKDKVTPNKMWLKRPYGQISKCTEAQCLRMAFPEFAGGHPSAEEMEGKEFDGLTIDADTTPPAARSVNPEEDFRPDPAAEAINRLSRDIRVEVAEAKSVHALEVAWRARVPNDLQEIKHANPALFQSLKEQCTEKLGALREAEMLEQQLAESERKVASRAAVDRAEDIIQNGQPTKTADTIGDTIAALDNEPAAPVEDPEPKRADYPSQEDWDAAKISAKIGKIVGSDGVLEFREDKTTLGLYRRVAAARPDLADRLRAEMRQKERDVGFVEPQQKGAA